MEALSLTRYGSWMYWRRNWRGLARSFFETLGVLWVLVEVSAFVLPQVIELFPRWIMLAVPLLRAMWECRPVPVVRHKLKDRDVWIEIRIADILTIEGSLIISTNSTFDTSMSGGLISRESLQGQFTKLYYDNETYLDLDLDAALKDEEFEMISGDRQGKTKRYGIGTVAMIQPRGRRTYMVAISDINEHGVASGSLEGVVESLGKLWHYIGERGGMAPLAIPVLGTGRARIQTEREEMIREIVGSFIAACSERKFCERLTIAVPRSDYVKHEMDLQELGDYLRYACRYTSLKRDGNGGRGRAIP